MSLGDILGLVGLSVAIYQIWRTGRIAKATQVAVEDAARRLSLYNLLLIIPELSRIEADIDRAARSNDSDHVRRLLREWRELAAEYRALLINENAGGSGLDSLIQESLTLSGVAKDQLDSGKSPTVLAATRKVRLSIEGVCEESRVLAARVRSSATPLGIFDQAAGQLKLPAGRNGTATQDRGK